MREVAFALAEEGLPFDPPFAEEAARPVSCTRGRAFLPDRETGWGEGEGEEKKSFWGSLI